MNTIEDWGSPASLQASMASSNSLCCTKSLHKPQIGWTRKFLPHLRKLLSDMMSEGMLLWKWQAQKMRLEGPKHAEAEAHTSHRYHQEARGCKIVSSNRVSLPD